MPANNPSTVHGALVAVSFGIVAVVVTVVAQAGPARAAASDVRVARVDCAGNPEVVEVKNYGTDEQSLAGWKLQSDGNDPFDLTPAGVIPAGASIFIESGPGAQATFKWSDSQVFRDNDATDYARLVDNAGVPKGQIACAQATAAPTAAPTATPTLTADQVPNGGGPPGAPDGVLSPAMLIYAGGSVIAAAVAFTVTWLGVGVGLEQRKRRRKTAGEAGWAAGLPQPDLVEPEPASAPAAIMPASRARVAVRRQKASSEPLVLAMIVAIAAAILVALLMQSQGSTKQR